MLLNRPLCALCLLSSSVFLVGCSPDTGGRVGVAGKVTLKGQPLETGTIQFVSADGAQMTGATITKGEYSVPADAGVKPGKYTVRVSSVKEAAIKVEEAPGDSSVAEQNQELIPAEFNVNSSLTADLGEGSNTHNVDIP